jgi:hypothetical protein
MNLVLFYLINTVAAPGVVLHELSHAVCCVLARVRIFKIKLFQFGDPAGYVEHAVPDGFIPSAMISFGPLIFNSLVALVFFSQFKTPYLSIKSILVLWLGIAAGLNAIPSFGDTKVLYKAAKKKVWKNPFVLLGFPFVLLLYLLNFLKQWRFHFLYTAALFWLGNVFLKH